MTLATLRLMRDVGHSKSISKAAQANGLTQSAASQALKEAERELGAELFDRDAPPLAGDTLRQGGAGILPGDSAKTRGSCRPICAALKRVTSGTVRVAAIYSVGLTEMAPTWRSVLRGIFLRRNYRSPIYGRSEYGKR